MFRFGLKTIFFATCLAATLLVAYRLSFHYTPGQQLVIASSILDVEHVHTLLAHGVDPNTRMGRPPIGRSNFGIASKSTPLLALAKRFHRLERDERRIMIARALVSAEADVDLPDQSGVAALAWSIYYGYDDLSLFLIASGAKLDTTTGFYVDGDGDISPMHLATESPEVLAAMINRGGPIHATTTLGATPLHWAARGGHIDSVRRLVVAGAELKAPILIAEVALPTAAASGNAKRVFSGWSPLLYYEGDPPDHHHSIEVLFNSTTITPGELTRCLVRLGQPEEHRERALAGTRFELLGGPKVTGVITEALGFPEQPPSF